MFQNLKLFFRKGTILTKESLCELNRYARDYLDINYSLYPNGISKGTEIIKDAGRMIIKRGLLKYKEEIYRMTEDIDLSQRISDWKGAGIIKAQTKYQLCFEEQECEYVDHRESQQLFSLKLNCRLQSDEVKGIYFASFKLVNDKDFYLSEEEDVTDSNYWNMINCLYSCRNGYTYHPYIFQRIAKIIEAKDKLNDIDYLILNQIYNEGVLSIHFMIQCVGREEKESLKEGLLTGGEDRKEFLKTFIESISKVREEGKEKNRETIVLPEKRIEQGGSML